MKLWQTSYSHLNDTHLLRVSIQLGGHGTEAQSRKRGTFQGKTTRCSPGILRQRHGLEYTDSNKVDSARMHVKEQQPPRTSWACRTEARSSSRYSSSWQGASGASFLIGSIISGTTLTTGISSTQNPWHGDQDHQHEKPFLMNLFQQEHFLPTRTCFRIDIWQHGYPF